MSLFPIVVQEKVSAFSSFSNCAVSVVKAPYTFAVKSVRLIKACDALSKELEYATKATATMVKFLDPLKILHIPIYTIKASHAIGSLFSCQEEQKLFQTWKLYGSLKKLTSGFETAFSVVKHITPTPQPVQSAFSFLWYVFLPNTSVEAAIGADKSRRRIALYRDSSPHLAFNPETEKVRAVCAFLENNKDRFHELKVFTEKNNLAERVDRLCVRLKDNPDDETNHKKAERIFSEIKSRMCHQIVHEVARTSFKVLSIVTLILATFYGVKGVTLAALELTVTGGRLGAFMFGKYVYYAK